MSNKIVSFRLDNESYEMLKSWCISDGYEDHISLYIRQMIKLGHETITEQRLNPKRSTDKKQNKNTTDDDYRKRLVKTAKPKDDDPYLTTEELESIEPLTR